MRANADKYDFELGQTTTTSEKLQLNFDNNQVTAGNFRDSCQLPKEQLVELVYQASQPVDDVLLLLVGAGGSSGM